MWVEAERPREEWIACIRRATRAKYHRAIRQVIRSRHKIFRENIAHGLLENNSRDFWHN